jgi:hypothetical protein
MLSPVAVDDLDVRGRGDRLTDGGLYSRFLRCIDLPVFPRLAIAKQPPEQTFDTHSILPD